MSRNYPGSFLKRLYRPSVRKPSKRLVKTSTVLQMEAVECGAAALAIILGYFGKYVPLEEVRLATNVSRDGTRANNIVRAARSYGLIAKGFQKSLESLQKTPMPVMIHWHMDHFLVVEGFQKDRVYLNDPAAGRYSVLVEDFDKDFTGVVLTFEPGPDFVPSGDKPGLVSTLLPWLEGSRKALLYVFLASLALVIPGLVIPAFTRVFVDQVLVQHAEDMIGWMLLRMAGILVLNVLLTRLQQHYLLRLETKLTLTMSASFFWHVLHLPMRFFSQRFSGDIADRITVYSRVAHLLSGQLTTTLFNLVTMLFYLALMFSYNVELTLVAAGLVAINAVALLFVARKRKDASYRLQKEQGHLVGTTVNGLRLIETLKASGGEGSFFSKWIGNLARLINAEQEFKQYSQTLTVVPFVLSTLTTVVVVVLGGLSVMEGRMTMGMLLAYKFLMDSFVAPVTTLVNFAGNLQTAQADLSRVEDVMRYQEEEGVKRSSTLQLKEGERTKLAGYLELNDVSFGYNEFGPPLIENFNLSLKPGGRVALVGESGSGKSTLAKIIAGLYKPQTGLLLFDSKGRGEIPHEILTNSLSYVDQDILLFEGTILDNLALWDSTLPESRLIQAAKDAEIHNQIAERENGYNGPVREGGSNFSGGERQRLEIARALAQDPSILILDEATSALDTLVEKDVMENIRRRGCTCIIIAHRLSTIRDSDEIIVLDQGKVVERGRHEDLLKKEGRYAEMIRAH